MPVAFQSLSALLNHGFDTVIDVRSPAEFSEDHVPGAINLPVLSNAERAEVGTIYVQQSRFLARKIGAAKVFRNAARHVEEQLMNRDGAWRPLVYCWRGGQRSGSFAWMLGQIGWRSETVEGGYQSYRRLVKAALYDNAVPHDIVLLDGYTGTAKTEILGLLQERGVQVLDLEGLAGHRGSLLGDLPDPQPSQKSFESGLAFALANLDPRQPVLIEAESSKIGQRIIPPSLWSALRSAPRIEISADPDERARYLARAYDDVLSDRDTLRGRLDHLRAFRGHTIVDGWFDLIAAGENTALTRALMQQHYDPAYEKSRRAVDARIIAKVAARSLDRDGLYDVAEKIRSALCPADQAEAGRI